MGDIIIVSAALKQKELEQISQVRFGDMVKAVVDIERAIIALGGELHAHDDQIRQKIVGIVNRLIQE